jgi:hypothetical protein
METKKHPWIAFLVLMSLAAAAPAFGTDGTTVPRFVVELETGPVWQSKNDVQIPNNEDGTRFSLVDVVGNGPWPAVRFYLTWNINPRHGLRALAAPLSITETGVSNSAKERTRRKRQTSDLFRCCTVVFDDPFCRRCV